MKTDIMTNVSRSINRFGFKVKKHSPEILIAAGVIGTVTSAVLACRATLKATKVIEETKKNLDVVHEATEAGVTAAGEEYTAEDSKKDLTIVYARAGLDIVKTYAPAVILGAASLGCIMTSHNIIRKRNMALAAAYATVDKGFKEYRGRVIERFGKELDRELKYNIKAKEIEETVINEDGTETTVKKTVETANPNFGSEYARFYDDGCAGWTKNPELNLCFLRNVQEWANKKLQADTYLYLNDVYEALGIPKTRAGQQVGWIYDEKNPIGDNYVDFGIYDLYNEKKRDFVNGHERVILLDFNVDGYILDLMP